MSKYKTEIKWAIIFIMAQLAWMIMEKSLGFYEARIEQHAIITNFFALVAFVVYALALLEKRKKDYQGNMTYLQGFVSGIIISLIVTLFVPLTQFLVSGVIAPEYFPNMISYSVETGKMSQSDAEDLFNMKSYIFQSLIFTPVAGLVTTALLMIFIRTKK